MISELTGKRRRIIDFINDFMREQGYPPTVRDIQNGCDISSTSVVDYHLKVLEKSGHIRRRPDVSRGIALRERLFRVQLPVVGTIAAGQPIPVPDAETWNSVAAAETIEVTPELTGGKEDVYALRVKGQSMVDALISDGDVVLMQYVTRVDNGEMAAVWLKAEQEATLKKVYVEPGRIRLQPANSQMNPIYTAPNNVEIQGRVIAVIRQISQR